MDVRKYIESGILEAFVLMETNEEQNKEILALAKQYPEINDEIQRIEDALMQTAQAASLEPPAALKEKVLASLNNSGKTNNNIPANNPTFKISFLRKWSYPIAAAVSIVLILSVLMNIWLYVRWKNEKEQLALVIAEKQLLASQSAKFETAFAAMKEKYALAKNPNISVVNLKGTPNMPSALADVYWDKQSGETRLDLKSLPNLPKDKQYQLWAIVDGKPVDAGVFKVGTADSALQKMKSIRKAQAFAVTIEKLGGSEVPTLDQMVLMGTAGG